MNNIQIFAKALLEQIEVARVRQLSGLKESASIKHLDTAKAISLFQKYTGLDRTGVPDPKTMHMIKMVAEGNGQTPRNPDGSLKIPGAAPAAAPTSSAALKPSGTTNAATAIPTGGLENPANQAKPPAAKPAVATQPAAKPAAKPKPVFDQSVQDLQKQLIAKGAKIKADGFMGPATQAAFKQFGPGAAPASGANPVALADPTVDIATPDGTKPPAPPAPPAPKPPAPAGDGGVDPYVSNGQSTIPAADDGSDPYVSNGQSTIPAPKPPAPAAPAAPTGIQAVGDDEGNTTVTRPDGSTMVVGPDGKQIMPGSNPNLPKNQGALNKIGNWFSNKGQYQKPGGFQPPPGAAPAPVAKPASQSTDLGRPDMGVSGESVNHSNQRMVEDPELTAMLRIAGLR